MRYLCEQLEAVERGDITRLMIFLPPRNRKSQTANAHFSAWYLGRHPDDHVITASYSGDLAKTFGRESRNLLAEHGQALFGVRLADDSRAADDWQIADHYGGLTAAGVGGAITGRGAHCFPAGTLVATEAGWRDIAELATAVNPPRLWAFDVARGQLELQPILASRKVWSDDLWDIQSSEGHTIRVTGDHRIFTPNRGYQAARDLRVGDPLIALRVLPDVPIVPRPEGPAQHDLSPLLFGMPKSNGDAGMRQLQSAIRTATVRNRQSYSMREASRILFGAMRRAIAAASLHMVWACSAEKDSQILFGCVSNGSAQTSVGETSVPCMPEELSAQDLSPSILQSGLRQRGSLRAYGRIRQFAFQRWHELRQMVSRNAPIDLGTRRLSMSGVSGFGGMDSGAPARPGGPSVVFGDSSLGRKPYQQPTGKSDYAVSPVSHETSQVGADTVSVVRRVYGPSLPVYDLQVAGPHNFFANQILVHNCLILDDLLRDREEANSPTMRDKVWDWYTSVAATRLEADGKIILIMTRWHEDDIAGRLLKAQELGEGDQWTVVRLPAEAEADDLLGRAPGEPLWPARFPLAWLQAQRRRIGSADYAALYQQRPRELHGGAFQATWFRWYHADAITLRDDTWYWGEVPLRVVIGIDPATTAKSTSDDWAAVVLGVTPTYDVLVLDVIAEPVPLGEQVPRVVELYRQYAPDRITVEQNAGQAYFVRNLKTWHRDKPGITPLPVKGLTSVGAKYDRIVRNVPLTEDGHVYLRQVRPDQPGWVDLDRLPGVKMHRRMVKLYQQLVGLHAAMEHDDAADAWDLALSGTRVRKWFADQFEDA